MSEQLSHTPPEPPQSETTYEPLDGFPFPVRKQIAPYFSVSDIKEMRHDREYFAYPTVSVPEKEKFLEEHIPHGHHPKSVLTVTGALWPAFYANIWNDTIQRLQTIDPNPKSLEYLTSLMKSDEHFTKMVKGYAPTLNSQARTIDRHVANAAYLADIDVKNPSASTPGELSGLFRHLPAQVQRFIPRPTYGAQIRERMRDSLNNLARNRQLEGTVGLLQDMPQAQIQQADFIDMSNVPEYDRGFPMEKLVEKVRQGSFVYMEEINHANPIEPKIANLPLEQIGSSAYNSTLPSGEPFQKIDFFLFRKK